MPSQPPKQQQTPRQRREIASKKPVPSASTASSGREERLAEALRENLRRRKAANKKDK